ncbi:hypothetical protein K7472_31375 [Streptomyces sp. PTM05]|uniref:Uncharacterized protein n=1 Tax=Streptantibioticus parmotrematis TaxID=2873249 RepID=A0ABS7R1I9_9ACTN|nr:hypothetical protein [Streptantibioticus parmotrematis]MBY8889310.1 hypothetical protein [Streptantibioticus parmotrematis]
MTAGLVGTVTSYADGLLAALLAVGAGWGMYAVRQRRRATAAVRGRVRFELVPAETFDAAEQEIDWFAGQLASVPVAAGSIPRRAAGTRIRLTCADGLMRFRLEGPARAASLLRMPGYEQVEVHDAEQARASGPLRVRFEGAPPLPVRGGAQ